MTRNTISNVRMREKRIEHHSTKPAKVSYHSGASTSSSNEDYAKGEEDLPAVFAHDGACWAPPPWTFFQILVSVRMSAAVWSPISDCDEVYNYWEPTHFLLYGKGFQTWEYSPMYALRSYLYIYLHTLPLKPFQILLPHTKITSFFFLRCFLGFMCALAELYLYTSLRRRFGANVARLWALFSVASTGMFISSCAFLPSSFSMLLNCLAVAAWLNGRYTVAIFTTAVSTLVGWPFAAILGIPIALDLLLKGRTSYLVTYAVLSGWAVLTCLLVVDTHYYGKNTVAPLNIVMYNVFSPHGPNLYGTAPVAYYIVNCLLNWNIVFPLAMGAPVFSVLAFYIQKKDKHWIRFLPVGLIFVSLFSWISVFFSQPHKEERFLFPIYPLLSLCAAICLDSIKRLIDFYAKWMKFVWSLFTAVALVAFVLMSISRSVSLYRNYHAPFDTYMALIEEGNTMKVEQLNGSTAVNICVGKEWHRFPSSFFIPPAVNGTIPVRLEFVRSEFGGLLPKHYPEIGTPAATRLVPDDQNDANREELSRYVDPKKCHYMVDLSTGPPDSELPDLEPDYSADTQNWEVVHEEPFLISEKSHRLLRAFYIPFISENYCVYGKYNLLRRKFSDFNKGKPILI